MEQTRFNRSPRGLLKPAGFCLCFLLAAACVIGWIPTWRTIAGVRYNFGTYLAPGAPGGDGQWWMYKSQSISLTSIGGIAYVQHTEYPSLAPTREGLQGWESTRGWETMAMSAEPNDAIWWRFHSASDWSLLGVGFTKGGRQGETVHLVSIPYWLILAGIIGPWALAANRRRRRKARIRAGRCPACNYNLAGLEPGAARPECGRES